MRRLSYAVLLTAVVWGMCMMITRKDVIHVSRTVSEQSALSLTPTSHRERPLRSTGYSSQDAMLTSISNTLLCDDHVVAPHTDGTLNNTCPRTVEPARENNDAMDTRQVTRHHSRLQAWLVNLVTRGNESMMHGHMTLHSYLLLLHQHPNDLHARGGSVSSAKVHSPNTHTRVHSARPTHLIVREPDEEAPAQFTNETSGRYVVLSLEDEYDNSSSSSSITTTDSGKSSIENSIERRGRERGRMAQLRRRQAILTSLYHFNFTIPQEVHVIDPHHLLVFMQRGWSSRRYFHALGNMSGSHRKITPTLWQQNYVPRHEKNYDQFAAMTLQSSAWRVMDVYSSPDAAPHKMSQKLLPLLSHDELNVHPSDYQVERQHRQVSNLDRAKGCGKQSSRCVSGNESMTVQDCEVNVTTSVDVTVWTAEDEAGRVTRDIQRMFQQLHRTNTECRHDNLVIMVTNTNRNTITEESKNADSKDIRHDRRGKSSEQFVPHEPWQATSSRVHAHASTILSVDTRRSSRNITAQLHYSLHPSRDHVRLRMRLHSIGVVHSTAHHTRAHAPCGLIESSDNAHVQDDHWTTEKEYSITDTNCCTSTTTTSSTATGTNRDNIVCSDENAQNSGNTESTKQTGGSMCCCSRAAGQRLRKLRARLLRHVATHPAVRWMEHSVTQASLLNNVAAATVQGGYSSPGQDSSSARKADKYSARRKPDDVGADMNVADVLDHVIINSTDSNNSGSKKKRKHRTRSEPMQGNALDAYSSSSSYLGATSAEIHPLWASGWTGKGEIVSIADTGLDVLSCFFRDDAHPDIAYYPNHSASHRKIVSYYPCDQDPQKPDHSDIIEGHGTHVAGSALGSIAAFDAKTDINSNSNSNDCSANNTKNSDSNEHDAERTVSRNAVYAKYNGVAPDAKLFMRDLGCAGYASLLLPSNIEDVYAPGYAAEARIASNSWGFDPLPEYAAAERLVDRFVQHHPDMLILYASGNNPLTGVLSPAIAKNVLTVGSHLNAVSLSYRNTMAASSSHGPVYDGRQKPEIAGPGGMHVYSACSHGSSQVSRNRAKRRCTRHHTRSGKKPEHDDESMCIDNNNHSYGDCSSNDNMGHVCELSDDNDFCSVRSKQGTSMATGVVAGAAAVMRQYMREFHKLAHPSAALLRGALIHSTVYLPKSYRVSGFGRLDLSLLMQPTLSRHGSTAASTFSDASANASTSARSAVESRSWLADNRVIRDRETQVYCFSAENTVTTAAILTHDMAQTAQTTPDHDAGGAEEHNARARAVNGVTEPTRDAELGFVKVTLTWTDTAAALEGSARSLIHDLDLVVVDSWGKVYYAMDFDWHRSHQRKQSGASSTVLDRVNNVEQVRIPLTAALARSMRVMVYGESVQFATSRYNSLQHATKDEGIHSMPSRLARERASAASSSSSATVWNTDDDGQAYALIVSAPGLRYVESCVTHDAQQQQRQRSTHDGQKEQRTSHTPPSRQQQQQQQVEDDETKLKAMFCPNNCSSSAAVQRGVCDAATKECVCDDHHRFIDCSMCNDITLCHGHGTCHFERSTQQEEIEEKEDENDAKTTKSKRRNNLPQTFLDERESGARRGAAMQAMRSLKESAICTCAAGSHFADAFCQHCETGWFGPLCNSQCLCENGGTCNKTTGLCDCRNANINKNSVSERALSSCFDGARCQYCCPNHTGRMCNEPSYWCNNSVYEVLVQDLNQAYIQINGYEHYPFSVICRWHIVAPPHLRIELNYLRLNITQNFGTLTLFDPLQKGDDWQANVSLGKALRQDTGVLAQPEVVVSKGNELMLVFESDWGTVAPGFLLQYRFVRDPLCPIVCTPASVQLSLLPQLQQDQDDEESDEAMGTTKVLWGRHKDNNYPRDVERAWDISSVAAAAAAVRPTKLASSLTFAASSAFKQNRLSMLDTVAVMTCGYPLNLPQWCICYPPRIGWLCELSSSNSSDVKQLQTTTDAISTVPVSSTRVKLLSSYKSRANTMNCEPMRTQRPERNMWVAEATLWVTPTAIPATVGTAYPGQWNDILSERIVHTGINLHKKARQTRQDESSRADQQQQKQKLLAEGGEHHGWAHVPLVVNGFSVLHLNRFTRIADAAHAKKAPSSMLRLSIHLHVSHTDSAQDVDDEEDSNSDPAAWHKSGLTALTFMATRVVKADAALMESKFDNTVTLSLSSCAPHARVLLEIPLQTLDQHNNHHIHDTDRNFTRTTIRQPRCVSTGHMCNAINNNSLTSMLVRADSVDVMLGLLWNASHTPPVMQGARRKGSTVFVATVIVLPSGKKTFTQKANLISTNRHITRNDTFKVYSEDGWHMSCEAANAIGDTVAVHMGMTDVYEAAAPCGSTSEEPSVVVYGEQTRYSRRVRLAMYALCFAVFIPAFGLLGCVVGGALEQRCCAPRATDVLVVNDADQVAHYVNVDIQPDAASSANRLPHYELFDSTDWVDDPSCRGQRQPVSVEMQLIGYN